MISKKDFLCKSKDSSNDYSISFSDGHTYKGPLHSKVMNGHGTYCWCDGIMYKGDFCDSTLKGKGEYTWPNKSSYTGDILNGLRHGNGDFYSEQNQYTGAWSHGQRDGKGCLYFDSNRTSYYNGSWVNNQKQGYGIEKYKSGNEYEGEWYKNKRHGNGTMRWFSSNEMYTGQWRNGLQHGLGKHIWYLDGQNFQYPLRNYYIGEWKNGVRDGYGSFFYASGIVYEGSWKNNKKNGHGKYLLMPGGEFECYFVDGVIQNGPEVPLFNYDDEVKDVDVTLEELSDIISSQSVSFIDFEPVWSMLLAYVTPLKHIYNLYSMLNSPGKSSSDTVLRKLQFSAFLRDINIMEHGISLFDAEGYILETLEPMGSLKNFMQHLLLIAAKIYKSSLKFPYAKCLESILNSMIALAGSIRGDLFSQEYTSDLKYIDKVWSIYDKLLHKGPQVGSVNYRDVLLLLKDCKFIDENFTSEKVVKVFSSYLQEMNVDIKLSFLEFCELLLRCKKVYQELPYAKETFWEQLQ